MRELEKSIWTDPVSKWRQIECKEKGSEGFNAECQNRKSTEMLIQEIELVINCFKDLFTNVNSIEMKQDDTDNDTKL